MKAPLPMLFVPNVCDHYMFTEVVLVTEGLLCNLVRVRVWKVSLW